MYCKHCGSEMPDDADVCIKCGKYVNPVHIPDQYLVREPAPEKNGAFICGLLGVLLTSFPLVGLIISIIGLSLSNKGLKIVNADPDKYDSIGMLNAGRVLSILGIILGALAILAVIILLIAVGGGLLYYFEDLVSI